MIESQNVQRIIDRLADADCSDAAEVAEAIDASVSDLQDLKLVLEAGERADLDAETAGLLISPNDPA